MNELIEPVIYAFIGVLIWDSTKMVYSKYFKNNKKLNDIRKSLTNDGYQNVICISEKRSAEFEFTSNSSAIEFHHHIISVIPKWDVNYISELMQYLMARGRDGILVVLFQKKNLKT